jgi:hypothetical protein
MAWQWQRSEVLDKRTCGACYALHGKRRALPQGPMHPRCRGVELLCWVFGGVVSKADNIAPMALLASEREVRAIVHAAIGAAPRNIGGMSSAVSTSMLTVRRTGRSFGRVALASEVTVLRPALDVSALVRTRVDRSDRRRANVTATRMSAWWLAAVALLVAKHHYDRKAAKEKATEMLKQKLEGDIITANAEGFGEERIKAASELRKLKEKKAS